MRISAGSGYATHLAAHAAYPPTSRIALIAPHKIMAPKTLPVLPRLVRNARDCCSSTFVQASILEILKDPLRVDLASTRALAQLLKLVIESPSLIIQATPIWLSFLDPSFIPNQEQLTAGNYDTAFEYRAANCVDAISMNEGNMGRPKLFVHSDAASRALLISGLHHVQAWAEHFLRVCLEDPLGYRAQRFWQCVHNSLELLGYEGCVPETVLHIAFPLWMVEARKRSVRQGEIQFGMTGRYFGGNYIATYLPLVPDDSSFHALLEAAGEDVVDSAHRLLRLALLGQDDERLKLSNAERALSCICTWMTTERLRELPGLFGERVIDTVIRAYAVALRLQSEARDAARQQETQKVIVLCCQYLQSIILFADTSYDLIAHAVSCGLLSLLVCTRPWVKKNSKAMHNDDINPVAELFKNSILGSMFMLPVFRAVVQAMLEMQTAGIAPLPETRAWYETLLQRVERWDAPYKRALDIETSIRQERRCHYSRVSPSP
jgi:hypothetical protein